MAKLIVLALAFAALVVFASAHKTIVTTAIEDDDIEVDNPRSRQQCSRRIQGERFDQCQRYLRQDASRGGDDNPGQQQQGLQQCCQELQNVDEQCQCEAVKQVFRQAQAEQQQQQHGQQGGRYGSQQIRQLKQKVQNLPNQCNLETRQCRIRTIMTITTIEEDTTANERHRGGSGSGSQECRQQVQRERFNQCQRYFQQQQQTGYETLLMSITGRREQQPRELQECCDELRNVEEQCQCEAIEEAVRQTERQQQQGRQQRSRRGGQPEQQKQELRRLAQNLPRQCDLEVQQCRIPSAMF